MKLFKKYFIGVLFLFIILGFFGFIDKTEAAPIDFIWGNTTTPPIDCGLIDVRFDLNKEEYAPNEDIVATMEIINVRSCLGQGIAIKVKKYYGGGYIEEGFMTVGYASNGATASFTFEGEPDHQSGSYIEVFRKAVCDPACNEYPYNPKVFKSLNIGSVLPPPSVNNLNHTSLTDTSVTLGANITSVGISGDTITNRGFCYSKYNSMPTFPASAGDTCVNAIGAPSAPWTGPFTANLSNLTTNTLYYYSAYATNSAGTGYAHMGQFTTYLAPTITNPTATDITTSSAKLGATVTSIGNPPYVIRRGFCVGTNPNPGYSYPDYPNGPPGVTCHDVAGGIGTFSFTKTTGLYPNTTYNYRGYVENPGGIRYTNNATFTTTFNPLTVYLIKNPGEVKNVVRAGETIEPTGELPLRVTIDALPSNAMCTLKLNNETKGTYSTNIVDITRPKGLFAGPNNNFKVTCALNSAPNTPIHESSTVSASGQSGTMNSPLDCSIPLGGSSCTTTPFNWTVVSPKAGALTFIKAENEQTPNAIEVYDSGAGSNASGSNVEIILEGDKYLTPGSTNKPVTLSLWNKVDGTNSSFSVDNMMFDKIINISCSSGSWNGNICAEELASGPDLTALPTTPTTAPVGSVILTSVIKNQGDASTGGPFENFFQYSTVDPTTTTGGGQIFTKSFKLFDLFSRKANADEPTMFDLYPPNPNPIGPLGIDEQRTIIISHSFQEGIYWVRACADKANRNDIGDIPESDEENNCSGWVEMNIYSGEFPDLIADSVVVDYLTPTMRKLNAVIKNQGNASTGIVFYNIFQKSTVNPYLDPILPPGALTDISPNPNPIGPLNAGAQQAIYTFHSFQEGAHWIRACADKSSASNPGLIDEGTNEGNNCSDWVYVFIGNNKVDGQCSDPATHYVCQSGVSDNPREYPDKYTWSCLGLNEGADVGCIENKLIMTGDLVPGAESCLIQEGESSCKIEFSWKVNNPVGLQTAVTNSSGNIVGTGHKSSANFNIKYDQETFFLYNNAQRLDQETVYSNCISGTSWDKDTEMCTAIVAPSQPDLTARASEPTTPIEAKVAREYTAEITNNGDGPVLFGFNNLFQIATDSNDESTIIDYKANNNPMSPLDVGESRIATVMITFDDEGTYEMRACADKEHRDDLGVVLESDEGNNCGPWVSITVNEEQKPDLTASLVWPTTVLAGEKMSFYSTISNDGNAATNYQGQDSFYNLFQVKSGVSKEAAPKEELGGIDDNKPSEITIDDYRDAGVGVLSPFGSVVTSVPLVFDTAGTYEMRACADKNSASDVNGVIDESNEENNCEDWRTITVLPAGSPIDGICGLKHNDCDFGEPVNPNVNDYFYTWQCLGVNNGGTTDCEEKIEGGGPGGIGIYIDFEAKPVRIFSGRSSTLTWEVDGANHCIISADDGSFDHEITEEENFDSSEMVNPTTTTIYTITCQNDYGENSEEAKVRVTNLLFREI